MKVNLGMRAVLTMHVPFCPRFKWGKPPSWKPLRQGQLTSGQQQAPEVRFIWLTGGGDNTD